MKQTPAVQMKIIVTGATGFVGGAVISQCIKDERVSEVLALTRRPLDEVLSQSGKVKVIINKDFAQYPPDIVKQLEGAEGCIWCLGGKVSDFGGDVQTARKVGVDYTLAAATAFIDHLAAKLGTTKTFSFVFCSGRGAEQDATKKLWMMKDTRLIKGEVESGLLDLAKRHTSFDAVMLRPGGILAGDSAVASLSKTLSIKLPDLAEASVEACINPPAKKILENEEIKQAAMERKLGEWVWKT